MLKPLLANESDIHFLFLEKNNLKEKLFIEYGKEN